MIEKLKNNCTVCNKEHILSDQNLKCCSKKCYKIYSHKENISLILEIENMYKFISFEEIKNLIENENYSFSMIYDYVVRDFNFSTKITLSKFREFFNKNIKCNNIEHCKKAQSFKLQFKYPKNWSEDLIKLDIIEKSKKGQKLTAISKKGKKNPKFKKQNSPFCVEFYTSRGFDIEYAKEKILEINVSGAIAAQKKGFSGLERKITKILTDNKIIFETQKTITLLPEEKIYNKKKYLYDIYIPQYNLLIECNGMFWHASKKIYKSGDKIKLPKQGEIEVNFIWSFDEHKKNVAMKRNFKFLTIWEDEFEKTMEIINDFICRN